MNEEGKGDLNHSLRDQEMMKVGPEEELTGEKFDKFKEIVDSYHSVEDGGKESLYFRFAQAVNDFLGKMSDKEIDKLYLRYGDEILKKPELIESGVLVKKIFDILFKDAKFDEIGETEPKQFDIGNVTLLLERYERSNNISLSHPDAAGDTKKFSVYFSDDTPRSIVNISSRLYGPSPVITDSEIKMLFDALKTLDQQVEQA